MAKLRLEPTIFGLYILQNSIIANDCTQREVHQLLNLLSQIFKKEFCDFHRYFFINQACCRKLKTTTVKTINQQLSEENVAMGLKECDPGCVLVREGQWTEELYPEEGSVNDWVDYLRKYLLNNFHDVICHGDHGP